MKDSSREPLFMRSRSGQVSEPGFVRIRTLSRAYTVPMQFKRFRLELPGERHAS